MRELVFLLPVRLCNGISSSPEQKAKVTFTNIFFHMYISKGYLQSIIIHILETLSCGKFQNFYCMYKIFFIYLWLDRTVFRLFPLTVHHKWRVFLQTITDNADVSVKACRSVLVLRRFWVRPKKFLFFLFRRWWKRKGFIIWSTLFGFRWWRSAHRDQCETPSQGRPPNSLL